MRSSPRALIAVMVTMLLLLPGCASQRPKRAAVTATGQATADGVAAPAAAAAAAAAAPAAQPSPATARPPYWLRRPAVASIEADDFDQLWLAADEAARHFGFTPDRLDYRGGVLTTLPLVSKQFWELWRNDVATLEDLANSSLSTYRRTLRFDIERTPSGRFRASPRVVIERYARTETPITASVYLRNAFRTQRNSRAWGSRETDRGVYLPRQYWYATGRDEALEKNVASEVRKQLERMRRHDDAHLAARNNR
jgi:hypothetical protein